VALTWPRRTKAGPLSFVRPRRQAPLLFGIVDSVLFDRGLDGRLFVGGRHDGDQLSLVAANADHTPITQLLTHGPNIGRPSNPYHLARGALEPATDRNRFNTAGAASSHRNASRGGPVGGVPGRRPCPVQRLSELDVPIAGLARRT
jgi:hypothetical protein